MTKGYYNSSDYKNYAWQFAELYFQSLTKIKDLTSALIIPPKEPLLETSKEKKEVSIAIWPEKTIEVKPIIKLTKIKVKLKPT
jgi:hypothetical protein